MNQPAVVPSRAPEVVLYTTSWCPYCRRAKQLFDGKGVAYREVDVETVNGARAEMQARSGRNTVPQIFIGERHLGGCDDTLAMDARGDLDALLTQKL
jgi:glutaredoxin 3